MAHCMLESVLDIGDRRVNKTGPYFQGVYIPESTKQKQTSKQTIF